MFLLIPVFARPLNQSSEAIVETTKDTYAEDSYFYFYVDNKRYRADVGQTWEDWLASDYNVDGFTKYSICNGPGESGTRYYLAKSVTITTEEID